MFVETKSLPEALKSALKKVDYHKPDIDVEVAEEESPLSAGGDGYKGFCIVVNLSSGESVVKWGSWGGANMFNPGNQVDLDQKYYRIPPDGAIIGGCIGGREGTWATITISPANANPTLLPAPCEITKKEKAILEVMGYVSSYRKQELARIEATTEEIESLVARGFIAKKGNGLGLTIKGKNAK